MLHAIEQANPWGEIETLEVTDEELPIYLDYGWTLVEPPEAT